MLTAYFLKVFSIHPFHVQVCMYNSLKITILDERIKVNGFTDQCSDFIVDI